MNIQLIIPEIFLAFLTSTLLGFGVSKSENRAKVIRYIGIAALFVFVLSGGILGYPSGEAFNGVLRVDDFGYFAKFIIAFAAIAALLFAGAYLPRENLDQYEYTVLMLYAVLGMSIMVSSASLLTLYIGLELQSLALYVLAAYNRDSLRSTEAGLKYFVLGAISSGLLLYGVSMIYGFTGTIKFDAIAAFVEQDGMNTGVVAGMVFMLCGLGFKISAAPFHMWTPDVYEGAPTPVTGFFAAAPKFAAMVLITRLVFGPFGDVFTQWQQVIIVFAVLSMFVGALGALRQTNIKRLIAYSSIANMGYALVPLAAGGQAGVKGMLIFMTIYVLTTIGVFACILQMRTRDGMVENISDLAGLSKTNQSLAVIFSILMFSLMGLPPFLGFLGKYFAFVPAFNAGLVWLVILALLASVIGASYYLRVIKSIWLDEEVREFVKAPITLTWLSSLTAIALFMFILAPFAVPFSGFIDNAAASLF